MEHKNNCVKITVSKLKHKKNTCSIYSPVASKVKNKNTLHIYLQASVAVLWFLTPDLWTKWPFVDCSVDWLILWIIRWINNLHIDFLLDLSKYTFFFKHIFKFYISTYSIKEMINYTNACQMHECGRGQGLLQQECQQYVFQPYLFFHFLSTT